MPTEAPVGRVAALDCGGMAASNGRSGSLEQTDRHILETRGWRAGP